MNALFDQGPQAQCPASFNLAEYVLAQGAATPCKIALSVLSQTGADDWTYETLIQAVRGTATGLLGQGLKPGDRVLMRIGNRVEFPITYLAALAVDLIPVPTSAMLTTTEITKIAAQITPKLIVAEDGVPLPDPIPCPVLNVTALRDMHSLAPAPFAMGDPNRPGYIIYTSGTSGIPRAVTHAHRAIWARRMMWDGWYGLTHQDRMLHAGAFNWTYTLGTGLLDPWTIGATALIPGHGITPPQLPQLMKEHAATIFAAAPGVYRQMLRADIPPLPNLRHGLSAGEKLPDRTRANWEAATTTQIHEAYGMSECSTFISGNPTQPAAANTLGRPQKGRRVAILNDGQVANCQTPGTFAIARTDPGLMLGYWSQALGGPEPITDDWFPTGDIMEMSKDHALTYLGRDDDMMNAGGFRVSPIEVETVFNTHPLISGCAAVEIKLRNDTSLIHLFYLSETDIPDTDLNRFASTNLARYKCPRVYRRIDALPKNPNGKIQRRALRQAYEAPDGQT